MFPHSFLMGSHVVPVLLPQLFLKLMHGNLLVAQRFCILNHQPQSLLVLFASLLDLSQSYLFLQERLARNLPVNKQRDRDRKIGQSEKAAIREWRVRSWFSSQDLLFALFLLLQLLDFFLSSSFILFSRLLFFTDLLCM